MFTGRIRAQHHPFLHTYHSLSSVASIKQILLILLCAFIMVTLILATKIVRADGSSDPMPDVNTPPTAETTVTTNEDPGTPSNDSPNQDAMSGSMVFLPLIVSPLTCNLSAEELAVFEFAQNHPAQGRASFTCDSTLSQVARAKAQDMAQRSYFGHVDPDGLGPNYHVRAAGYVLPTWYGTSPSSNNIESIAAGYVSAESAWNGWLNSSGHRTHVLAESSFWQAQTNIGIGYYYDPASPYKHYWVFLSAPPE